MTLALGQDEISSSQDQTLPCERSVTVLALTAVTQPSTPPCLTSVQPSKTWSRGTWS